jgi:hypothetical protein
MRLLFEDQLAPITSNIGFLEQPLATTVEAYLRWERNLQAERGSGYVLTSREVNGSLKEVLLSLLPLNAMEARRCLFVPTDSPWVAYFDNGWQGSDPSSMIAVLSNKLHCRGFYLNVVPHSRRRVNGKWRGRYGIVNLTVYDTEKLALLEPSRVIRVMKDDDGWEFFSSGEPFPFEETERYQKPHHEDRFTVEMLSNYLQHLGLFPFDEAFYLPNGNNTAILIEKTGVDADDTQWYSLADARKNF